jgi:hypothetical protein
MNVASLTDEERTAVAGLAADLGRVFGSRLHSVAAYGLHAPAEPPRVLHTLALVEQLTFKDLTACLPFAAGWRRRSLAVPLVLEREEFLRTLDVFPLEYGDIIAHHVLVAGAGTSSTVPDPTALLSRYIAAVEQIWEYVDTWRARA